MNGNSQHIEVVPPFTRSQSAIEGNFNNNPQRLLLMTHTSTIPTFTTTNSFPRSTLEGAMSIRDNLNNVIREIQPLMETARTVNARSISISNLLNRPAHSEPNISRPASSPNANSESVVINFDNVIAGSSNNAAILLNDLGNSANENGINNNSHMDGEQERAQAEYYKDIISRYLPFFVILFLKGLYDYHQAIFDILVLFATFVYANAVVKNEASKRQRRSFAKLVLALFYVIASITFINYIFEEEKIYLNLVFVRTYSKPLSVWDLLWVVIITDIILKLITVAVKIIVTVLPDRVLPFQKRGKTYLFCEAISQMYRSLATIQPWLFYLLESYTGAEKIIGVVLFALYMVCKGGDLMSRLKLLRIATVKLAENVSFGSSPSKEQIQVAGEHCPICHDEYNTPVLLHCRHIFCEGCISTWFDREQTCPLCRAKVVDDPSWRDGSTTFLMQLF